MVVLCSPWRNPKTVYEGDYAFTERPSVRMSITKTHKLFLEVIRQRFSQRGEDWQLPKKRTKICIFIFYF